MNLHLPERDPMPAHPYRAGLIALAVYLTGIALFAAWSLLLNEADMQAVVEPLLYVKGFPLGTAALVESLELVFLFAMAFTFLRLYRRARQSSLHQAEQYNARLKKEYQHLKQREKKLEEAVRDLERFSAMATGREQRILDLKEEVNALLQEHDQPIRYNTLPTE